MNKEELEELIWNTLQAYIHNNPNIRNEDKLEDLLYGVVSQIALEILTKQSTGLSVKDYITEQVNERAKENGQDHRTHNRRNTIKDQKDNCKGYTLNF